MDMSSFHCVVRGSLPGREWNIETLKTAWTAVKMCPKGGMEALSALTRPCVGIDLDRIDFDRTNLDSCQNARDFGDQPT